MDSRDAQKRRINGALTGSFLGKQVTILGQCLSFEGKQLKLKCTDGHVILVHLVNQMPHSITANCYVDVEGTVETRNKIKADRVYVYDSNCTTEFDSQLYNEMIGQMMSHGEANTFYVTNVAAHNSAASDGTDFAV